LQVKHNITPPRQINNSYNQLSIPDVLNPIKNNPVHSDDDGKFDISQKKAV
jgi:hypothetical protein